MKRIKITSLITAALLLLTPILPANAYAEQKLGDVNGDGESGVADLVALSLFLSGNNDSIKGTEKFDINSDNKVNIFDLVYLRKCISGCAEPTNLSEEFTPPSRESLVHEGEMISEESYQILLNTAKLFGIKKYTIEFSEHPIEYAYTDPGLFYCMRNGIAYGYGVQVIPGSEVLTVAENMPKIKTMGYKKLSYIAYRPLVDDDDLDYVLENFASTESAYRAQNNVVMQIKTINEPPSYESYVLGLEGSNYNNSFQFINWYLIPIDENGRKLEISYPTYDFDTSVTSPVETKYWIDNNDLTSGGAPITRGVFYRYVTVAKQLGIPAFEIKYNESKTEPIYYSFVGSGLVSAHPTEDVAVQVVPGKDVVYLTDLSMLDDYYYNVYVNQKSWFWTLAENDANTSTDEIYQVYSDNPLDDYQSYVMIPLDAQGNEDLRLYITQ